MKKYKITYWGRRGDEGYDWKVARVKGKSEEDALENLKIEDRSFKSPFETMEILRNYD